jgi:hypothetical protein
MTDKPTLLMDEADTYLEGHEEFRGILNSGHTPDTAKVLRCVGQDHDPKGFSTWAPMVIAKIGPLPATLTSRSLVIQMRRKRPDESVEKFDPAHHGPKVEQVARNAARWAQDNLDTLRNSRPAMPEELINRAADNWTPLLAIADAIGGEWPDRARTIAVMFCGGMSEVTLQEQVLFDIREVFDERGCDRVSSTELCNALGGLEGRPWCGADSGFAISPHKLASMLRPFHVKPHSIRIGVQTPKGYERKDFEDVFARYLPEKRNSATNEEE